jgi:tRNA (adenine57-N1/adenine58-N1)-methyltransferase
MSAPAGDAVAGDGQHQGVSTLAVGKKRALGSESAEDSDVSESPNRVRAGDCVVLYAGFNNLSWVHLREGGETGHRHGKYFHDDIIGREYGSAVSPRLAQTSKRARNRKRVVLGGKQEQEAMQVGGTCQVLRLTPELWAEALTHRTQITFALDNQMVAAHLHLRPGSVVCESGTGSGGLTAFLARAVAPHGRVHTFEFNAVRHAAATEDFAKLGLSPGIVRTQHADVYAQGFGAELAGSADAVFLDLPSPWAAIPHALRALKPFGRLATFSPCIEQVQRSVELLTRLGCSHLSTVTVLLREQRVHLAKTLLPEVIRAAADRERLARPPKQSRRMQGEAEMEQPHALAIAEARARARAQVGEQAEAAQKTQADLYAHRLKLCDKFDDDEQDVVPYNAADGPVYPTNCRFRTMHKAALLTETSLVAYDRHAGHTGYLTFCYAPL